MPEKQTRFLSEELRVLDRYELQDDLVETLQATNWFQDLAVRVARCHRSFSGYACKDHGHRWAEPINSCGCRLCPHDQRRRSLIMVHRFAPVLLGRPNLRYIVFSEKNSADLVDGIRSLFAAWDRLRRSAFWKHLAIGAIVALEITYNREENTWHPHLNVLFDGEFIPFEDLLEEWIRATRGNGRGCHIQKADEGTVRELLKYVTKLTDLLGIPEAVQRFLLATARRRFVRTYGVFFRIPIEDDAENFRFCPDCNSAAIIKTGPLNPWQVSLDFEGVFRVRILIPIAGAGAGAVAVFDRGS